MNKYFVAQSLVTISLLGSASSWAAVTPCDAIVEKVHAKLERKGVNDYTLKIVPKETETKLRVVGVCEGGKKKIIYHKQKGKKQQEQTEE